MCVRALSFAYVCIGQTGTCRFLGAGGYKVFRREKWGVGVVLKPCPIVPLIALIVNGGAGLSQPTPAQPVENNNDFICR